MEPTDFDPKYIKAQYGATHYSTMKDGVTPQMYYKQENVHYNDGTTEPRWVYLSFTDVWVGSCLTEEEIAELIEIN